MNNLPPGVTMRQIDPPVLCIGCETTLNDRDVDENDGICQKCRDDREASKAEALEAYQIRQKCERCGKTMTERDIAEGNTLCDPCSEHRTRMIATGAVFPGGRWL